MTIDDIWLPAALAVGGTLVATLVVGVILVLLPADSFNGADETKPAPAKNPVLKVLWKVGKNLLGAVLIVAGIVMFVAPGPGVLTILLGVVLVDIPGRYRLVQKIISRPRIFKAVNALRRRFGKPPFTKKDGPERLTTRGGPSPRRSPVPSRA